jgi:putative ABC transport system ATP-binding protein
MDHGQAAARDGHIELRGVAKRYEVGEVTVTALEGVDLDVAPGSFVVILGPSGSGKTTLLNLVGALDSPTEGHVTIGGRDISQATRSERFEIRRHAVSFVFQSFNLFPGLTAVENVAFGAEVAGCDDPWGVSEVVLGRVGLADRLDHVPHQMSGGEQQRVAIARALATENPVLLADEPTGELDFHTGVQILELLREQAASGKSVLVVTHNREISRVADRVVELSSGHIVSDGPPVGGVAAIDDLRW